MNSGVYIRVGKDDVLSHRYIAPNSDEYYDHSKVLEILDKVNKENVNER